MTTTSPPPLPVPRPSEFSAPFWEATKRRVLLLQYDAHAERYQFFARPVSVFSGRAAGLEWRPASGGGSIYSFTIVRHGPTAAWAARVPYVVASVHLDEDVRIMAHIVDCPVDDVRIGTRVGLRWEPRGDYNIPVFAPVK